MAEQQEKANRSNSRPDPKIIKEGGYQPTTDPGPVPTSLVRPANPKPPEKPQQPQGKK